MTQSQAEQEASPDPDPSPDPSIRAGLKLLSSPNVGKMFVAYLVSYTGTAMAPIALAFGVLELTGSAKDSAIVIAAPTLAAVFVLLFGGVVADRTSRKRVMWIAESVSMLAQFGMAWLFLSGTATVGLLTGLMLVHGVVMAFHQPAAVGFIVQLVEAHELQAANAVLSMARFGAFAGGAALGGLLVATVGPGWTLAIDAASFGVSALLVYSLVPKLQRPPEKASLIEDLRLGWREFTAHTWLWVIVAQFSLVVAGQEAIFGLLGPAYARTEMAGAGDWGLIAGGFGLGTLVGALLGIQVRPRFPMRFGTFCVFAMGGLPLALAYSSPLALAIVVAFSGGVAGQIFGILWYTVLQKKVPHEMLSRVSAYDHLGSIALAPLGIVVAGFLFEGYGYQVALLVAAALIIVPTIAVLFVADVRNVRLD